MKRDFLSLPLRGRLGGGGERSGASSALHAPSPPLTSPQGKGTRFALALLLLLLSAFAPAQSATQQIHFRAIDITVDPHGQPLAAYQFEFIAPQNVKLVGVEGGEQPAFAKAPYYDTKALSHDRVIVAALSTDAALPNTATRVARLHLEVIGDTDPNYQLKLVVAGDKSAKAIDAAAGWKPSKIH